MAILPIAWQSGKAVFGRLLDGVEPEIVDEIRNAVARSEGVLEVTEVRVRWLGHRLHTEVNIAVPAELSVEKGHQIATQVRQDLLHHLPFLSNATVHIDPLGASGERHHQTGEHSHTLSSAHS
jgi:divalent metal cation (Fe/Co/Zn/Cd) transporter